MVGVDGLKWRWRRRLCLGEEQVARAIYLLDNSVLEDNIGDKWI